MAPSDWHVLITDVKGSTRAISQGRYKQVNMIGAASITCIVNCLQGHDFPFVFGGDGATALVPPEALNSVSQELRKLQEFSKSEFQLELRVGLVPVNTLQQMGCTVSVAKYQLTPGNYLAQFRGGGIAKAEEMVKQNHPQAQILEADPASAPNLEGLSCRLNPLKSNRGVILSLLCKPKDTIILQEVLSQLKTIFNGDFLSASPVRPEKLKWPWPPTTLFEEARMTKGQGGLVRAVIKTLLKTLLVNASLSFDFPLGPFLPRKYKSELVLNCDFKKFDETLRMVIDCTQEQARAIEELFRQYHQEGKIHFGLHKSKAALMTCMVFSATQNQHIHFIDGADGGYALAAAELKKQLV